MGPRVDSGFMGARGTGWDEDGTGTGTGCEWMRVDGIRRWDRNGTAEPSRAGESTWRGCVYAATTGALGAVAKEATSFELAFEQSPISSEAVLVRFLAPLRSIVDDWIFSPNPSTIAIPNSAQTCASGMFSFN
mmetsp:Transcript_78495/g.163078  ORF Transcript_78495/g.163078 Transcript_78495/m.163078 type:complete len:133 (-) Transcript_78495:369-767(-)